MPAFIELTHEEGHPIILNTADISEIAPLGGDELRGCAVTLTRIFGENVRRIRVQENVSQISHVLRAVATGMMSDQAA